MVVTNYDLYSIDDLSDKILYTGYKQRPKNYYRAICGIIYENICSLLKLM